MLVLNIHSTHIIIGREKTILKYISATWRCCYSIKVPRNVILMIGRLLLQYGWCQLCRFNSFVFFFVSRNTKLYETGCCFAEFRSFRETEKSTKIRKKSVSSWKKSFRFVVSHIFIKILNLLFEFRIFYFCFVSFIRVVYLFSSFILYLLTTELKMTEWKSL